MKDSSGRYISSMTRLWWECWEAATKHAEDAYVESAISHGWDAQEVEHVMRAADMRAALESLTGRNP